MVRIEFTKLVPKSCEFDYLDLYDSLVGEIQQEIDKEILEKLRKNNV